MTAIFKLVQLLCIQLLFSVTAFADTGVKCHFTKGPVGFGYYAACERSKPNWYPNFDAALVDIYAAERHGLINFDWDVIHAECRAMYKRKDFCENL